MGRVYGIGIRSCTFPGPCSPDALQQAAGLGFDVVELSFNRQPELDCHDAQAAKRFGAEAERLGLLLTAHAPEDTWLCDPDPDSAAAATDKLAGRLEGLARFGARSVVVHACPYRPRVPGRELEQADSLRRSLTRLGKVCEGLEVGVLVEPLTRQADAYTSNLDHIIAAVDQAGSPQIGICIDTNHVNTTEALNPAVQRAGHRVMECHCNDNHGIEEEHLLPFDGEIDWPRLGRVLAEIGFHGPLIMEPSHFDERRFNNILSAAAAAAEKLHACMQTFSGRAE